jgi:hypothetical protein
MARSPAEPPKESPWASGPGAHVFVYDGFEDDLRRASEKDQAKLKALLRDHFCEFGAVKSPDKWNADEGTHSIGTRKIRLQAAKGHQCRVYGVVGSWNGKKAFFVAGVDPKKKQNKANPQVLKRSAEMAVRMIEEIEGASA